MSEPGFLNLQLQSVQKDPIDDPETRIEVFRMNGSQGKILEFEKQRFPLAQPLPMPSSQPLVCSVMPRRFRFRKTDIFTLSDADPLELKVQVLRHPEHWRASFSPWNGLPADFSQMKDVLRQGALKVMDGENLGIYTEGRYDLAGDPTTTLAKATLLNLCVKLRDTKEPIGGQHSWFSFVRRILVIDRERLFAIVDPEMMEIVRRVRSSIHDFDAYENADHSKHVKKLKKHLHAFKIEQDQMLSIKTDERHANLQLTLAPAVDERGESVMLLDADLDENGDLLNHLIDVLLIHHINGGTHPFDIFEFMVREKPKIEMGYELVVN